MHRGTGTTARASSSAQQRIRSDIKPANIFVSAEGIVRLGDLGLGKAHSIRSDRVFIGDIAQVDSSVRKLNLHIPWSARRKLPQPIDRRPLTVHPPCSYYMSPERIQENACGYDFRSDIWSLGCILYEVTPRVTAHTRVMDLFGIDGRPSFAILRRKLESRPVA